MTPVVTLSRSGRPKGIPGEPVGTVRLDDVVPRADFIKMDVEGAEELALRGAAGLLERCRPVVMFEVNHEAARRLGRAPTERGGSWRRWGTGSSARIPKAGSRP